MLRPSKMSETIARRLARAPLCPPSAADEAPLPPDYNALAYGGQYAVLPSTIAAAYAAYAGNPTLRLSPRLALLGAMGMPCCAFRAAGCPCSCSRRMAHGGYGGERLGYTMVDSDWPGIDWRIGIGPGPFVEYPEVFPLHGRTNIAPYMGY